MVLVQNLKFFPSLFFRSKRRIKSLMMFQTENWPFSFMELRMAQNLQFSRGVSPWFWSKICLFLILCFLDEIGP